MSLNHERLFTEHLRRWLLLKMPAKCTELNLLRAASLRAPVAGPYTIPASSSIQVSITGHDSSLTTIALTAGSRTAAQLVTEINAGLAGIASDDDGTLVLTSTTPPAAPSTHSLIAVGADNLGTGGAATGVNAALGFSPGGEAVRSSPLVWFGIRSVPVGWVINPDWPSGLTVLIGDTTSLPASNIRRDTYDVRVELNLLQVERQGAVHRNREHMQAAVQAVREVLQTDAGRQVGRAGTNDVALVVEESCRIAAQPFQVFNGKTPTNIFFDGALMQLSARVFLQPAAS